jgi:uncharacterized Zn finger protein (UPF0148 family)
LAETRKVTLKASWMDETDQFRVSKPAPLPSERPCCPDCEIPLRTSPDGSYFCWICEKRFDHSQTKAPKKTAPPQVKAPKKTVVGSYVKEENSPPEELDFELEMEEGDNEGDGLEDIEEEVDGGSVAKGPDVDEVSDEEELDFEIEDEAATKGLAHQDDVPEDGHEPESALEREGNDEWVEAQEVDEGEHDGSDEGVDFELSDDQDDDSPIDEVDEEDDVSPGAEEVPDEEDVTSEEELDFELDLTDGPEDEERGDDADGAIGRKDVGRPPQPPARKRFIDQSEVEFD